MDAPAQRFVHGLKEARDDEAARAEARRTLRSDHLVRQQRERRVEARDALRFRVQQRIRDPQSSAMEQSLFDTIRRTAAWWDAICDHAVEQKLHKERAERETANNHAGYLRSVKSQETREEATVVDRDTQRWLKAQEAFFAREKERKAAAIQDVIATLQRNTEACVDFLDRYAIEDSRSSALAQFGLSDVIQRSYVPPSMEDELAARRSRSRTTEEAFRAIFKGCHPFHISSPYFPSLFHALLHKTRIEGFRADAASSIEGNSSVHAAGVAHDPRAMATGLVFDVSRVPVFAVGGAKYSGKSILTDYLVSTFGFVCFSDRDLVDKALHVYQQQQHSSDGASGSSPVSPAVLEWTALGEEVEQRLLNGASVPPALVAKLVATQLREVQSDPNVRGVVFDGVLNSAEAFQLAQEAVLPGAADAPLQALVEEWCGSSASTSDGVDSLVAAWLAPVVPPVEDQQPRKENKNRMSKKAVDLSSLLPPVLPSVDDVSSEVSRERAAIEQAAKELASGYGCLASAFFYMDCPPQEIFRRYAGLRRDKETGEEYHMTFHPPPEERVAHLVSMDRTRAHTAQLADLVFHQQHEWQAMRRWLRENPSTSPSIVVELDGAATIEELHEQVTAAVQCTMDKFARGLALQEAMRASQQRIRQLEATRRAQEAARDAERQRLVELYTEKGVSPLPVELTDTHGGAGGTERASVGVPAPPPPAFGSPPSVSLTLCDEIPRGVAEVVFPTLLSLTEAYKAAYRTSWEGIAGAANLLLGYRVASQAHIRRYWEATPDDKQLVLDRFVEHFNTVPNHLRSRNVCKDELHGIIDDLKNALFSSVAGRKRACAALIDVTTHRDAFLDSWSSSICTMGVLLSQAEAVRFTALANLVVFYFSALVGEPLPMDEVDVLDVHAASSASDARDALLGSSATSPVATAGPASVTTPGTRNGASPTTAAAAAVAVSSASSASGGGKRLGGPNAKRGTSAAHGTGAGVGSGVVAGGHSFSASGRGPGDGAHGGDRATQEAFAETVQRMQSAIGGLVERLRTGTKGGGGKAEKKAAAAASTLSLHPVVAMSPAKLTATLAKCLPILESELAKTLERMDCVRDYVAELMQQGEAYRQRVRGELHSEATGVLKREAAAVNTAVYILRCRVEEERLAPRMHLGCGTFAVLREWAAATHEDGGTGAARQQPQLSALARARGPRQPSFLTDVPLYQELATRGVKVHATLTAARLFDLIDTFAGLAPNYQLSRDDFILSVAEDDYAGAAVADAVEGKRATVSKGSGDGSASPLLSASPSRARPSVKGAHSRATLAGSPLPAADGLKTVADVFHAFDPHGTGFVDWREFVVHLLLWCAPPPPRPLSLPQRRDSSAGAGPAPRQDVFHLPEATIEQLLETKADAGLEALAEDAFRDVPFFFDAHVPDDRLAVFTEALWRTFRSRETNTVDMYALFFFLCNDPQPVRGAQKAFHVLSSEAPEGGGITAGEMERMFHTHATNARHMGTYDPFSRQNQNLLFSERGAVAGDGPALLTFEEMCSSLMGRKMINSLDVFRRKRFVEAEPS